MPPPSDGPHRGLLNAAACAGMFVFGIVMALLGAVLPALVSRLEVGLTDIGTLLLVMNGTMLATSLVLGPAMDRFGMKPAVTIGPALVALALAIVAQADALSDLFLAGVLLGVGGGALNGATNTLVADLYDEPRKKGAALNALGIFYGFGAVLLPFAVGSLLTQFSIAALLRVAGGISAVTAAFVFALRFPPPKQARRLPLDEMPRFLRNPLVLALAFLLFFESGVEFTLGAFVSTYLTRDVGVTVQIASWALAGYWGSIVAGRFLLSRSTAVARPHRVLYFCALGAGVGALITAAAPNVAVTIFGIVLTGLSLAGIYPTTLAVAAARFQRHSGTVFGILFAVGLAGGIVVPWTAGQVGAAAGLRWVFVLVAVCYAAIVSLTRFAARREVLERAEARATP